MKKNQKYLKIKQKLETLRQEYTDTAKAAFTEGLAEIFELHPNLQKFSWRQYSLYFNDGDACPFAARTDPDSISMTLDNIVLDRYEGDWTDEASNLAEVISDFLQTFDDEIFEDLFGNHVEVTVNRDGTSETEGCDHD